MKELTVTAILIKCRFDPPARLISDDELAAALGLAYQRLKKDLPEQTTLRQLREDFLSDKSNETEEKLYKLIDDYIILNNVGDDWYEMMELAYRYRS